MTTTTPTQVNVLRPFAAYRCERSLVCCHEPFAAVVTPDDEVRLRAALAETEAGRTVLATLGETIIDTLGDPTRGREWKKYEGRCMHLVIEGDPMGRGCGLHHIVGLGRLPASCRNFPRIVRDTGDALEVSFELSCPTAARLLSEDPEPMTIATLPAESWSYPAVAHGPVSADHRALRDAWWRVFRDGRKDASAALAAIGALLESPLAPPSEPPTALPEALGRPAMPMAAMIIVHSILTIPQRAMHYALVAGELTRELTEPWTVARMVMAAEPAPELLMAFVEHQAHQLVLHPATAPEVVLTLAARRALAVLRVVDGLCDRVPFRTRTLFSDAFTACARIDPALGRPESIGPRAQAPSNP